MNILSLTDTVHRSLTSDCPKNYVEQQKRIGRLGVLLLEQTNGTAGLRTLWMSRSSRSKFGRDDKTRRLNISISGGSLVRPLLRYLGNLLASWRSYDYRWLRGLIDSVESLLVFNTRYR